MGADQLEDYSTSPSKTPLLLEIITSTTSCQRTVFFNTCATLFLEVCLEARPEACIQYDWLIFLAFVMVTSYGINIPAISVSRVAWKRNFGGICVFLSHYSVLETLT